MIHGRSCRYRKDGEQLCGWSYLSESTTSGTLWKSWHGKMTYLSDDANANSQP